MLSSVASIPLALYIHIPWCVRKCPYCDFNSHELNNSLDTPQLYREYVDALLADAVGQAAWSQGREIASIFIGGGTPSLLPIHEYRRLFLGLRRILPIAKDCEVTMEANPGTLEYAPFEQYLEVGINRLSIGVQSFDSDELLQLGRIHTPMQAESAISQARQAGFSRVNVDLMHGLPQQTPTGAVRDIQRAHEAGATHLSWYQLTIEPNTVFYRDTPLLPDEDRLAEIEEAGQAALIRLNYRRYEVSAWSGEFDQPCRHNVNYWQFGDYLALGAGAHGKISFAQNQPTTELTAAHSFEGRVARFSKSRMPKDYLDQSKWMSYPPTTSALLGTAHDNYLNHPVAFPKTVGFEAISDEELPSEFMLNALRLEGGVEWQRFTERTGVALTTIQPQINRLIEKGLLVDDDTRLLTTEQGRRYLNQVLYEFI